MEKNILVTGGAGYIGSVTSYQLAQKGFNVIILDTFLHNQSFSPSWAKVIQADFADEEILHTIFNTYKIDAVMHFAAFIEVGESVKHPQRFYDNNVVKTIKLLNSMLKHNIKKFIFSSSCAVYGEPIQIPIDESHPLQPISPYGKNKLTIEFILNDYAHAYNLQSVSLRYFNAAGAIPEEGLGEQHNPETHIIPLIIKAIKNDLPFKIFGNDYNTKDGSCIRDYVHVKDIAHAHVLSLYYLEKNKINAFNLGTGQGFSVKEIIHKMESIYNKKIILNENPRREGDPAILLANPQKANSILQWKPTYSNLENILQSALAWDNLLNHDAETASQVQSYSHSMTSDGHVHK